MNTMIIPLRADTTKRARILPLGSPARDGQFPKPARQIEGTCELNTVLDDVLTSYSRGFANKFVSPISEGTFIVRVSEAVLKRVIGLILEGIWSLGLWRDGEHECISPVVCKCLNGYGALLELTDETMSLPPALLAQLSQPGVVRPENLPSRQLLMARDLIERYGGRLCAHSPLWEEKTGTSIRLFLPLAAHATHHSSARV